MSTILFYLLLLTGDKVLIFRLKVELRLTNSSSFQEINKWISHLLCLQNYLYICLDNRVFQIEMKNQKMIKTYDYDLESIQYSAISDYFLIFASKKGQLVVNSIKTTKGKDKNHTLLNSICVLNVHSEISGVQFCYEKKKFAVLGDINTLSIFKLIVRAYFSNSDVNTKSLLRSFSILKY